ncbi:MAG: S1/P1 Nuclease [Bacteroidia bacterium]|nr:S1/P1 Nuclease [Bacteroidia bacterium]
MNKKSVSVLLFLLLFFPLFQSWGTWGHHYINRAAVFALPEEMRAFFYNHIDFITEESIVPDLRKHLIADKNEGPRHFFDVEDFNKSIDSLPQFPKEAYALYDDKMLGKSGKLPWYIQEMMEKLTKAFKEKRKNEVLFLAGDLGHYLGDAHMPLHTSSNYDGQLTAQKGIHAFWESQLPEKFGKDFNMYVGEAVFIKDVPAETWNIIKNSHSLADSLLLADKKVREMLGEEKLYKKNEKSEVTKNKFNQPVQTDEYAALFYKQLNGMVEKQMRKAIKATSSFWYTAWVNAGKPDLSSWDDADMTAANKKNYKREFESWKKGKVFNIKVDNEFPD